VARVEEDAPAASTGETAAGVNLAAPPSRAPTRWQRRQAGDRDPLLTNPLTTSHFIRRADGSTV
jgi:hypothetical protein